MGVVLSFTAGTLELRGLGRDALLERLPTARWDERTACHRLAAVSYAELLRWLVAEGIAVEDCCRAYQVLTWEKLSVPPARPYQKEALLAWRNAQGRGTVVLPTGSGKTHVALLAIADRARSTLVVTPTLDLVRQWYDVLKSAFGLPVGVLGGGDYEVLPLTVSTYDSAHLHVEHLGNRFGLLVFDEVHHLPAPSYQLAARLNLAPYRLGLTATPELGDEAAETLLTELVGPIVYQREIEEFAGQYLADYDTQRLPVELSPEERLEYEQERATYLGFLRKQGLRLGGPQGFTEFLRRAARSTEGRRALDAYRRQRILAVAASAKLDLLGSLLVRHAQDRSLVFTVDNATAYAISRRFLIPAITHHTRVKERSRILERFASGCYQAVVTSKVLNEGVDVPEANVAIVVSGTGSVREHVQRLGRILRPRDGKQALLYELVTRGTGETTTSDRRREHAAYRG